MIKIDKTTSAILALIFGVLILLRPDVLAILVGLYLVIYAVVQLATMRS